jgi:hypothetical protein
VTPSRIEENIQSTFSLNFGRYSCSTPFSVVALPEAAFEKLERAATSHKPQRGADPSKTWGVDIFN